MSTELEGARPATVVSDAIKAEGLLDRPHRLLRAASRSWPLILVALTLVVVASRALGGLGDNDIWWHIRLGDDLIRQHSLAAPHWSPFATQAWTPTEPLLEIVGAWLRGIFGWAAIKWLFGLGLVGLTLSVYFCIRRLATPALSSLCTVAVLLGCSLSLSPRPQLASFALIAVVLGAWLDSEKDGRPRWWLVPLTWLWSLVHGMWIFGVGFGVVFVVAIALNRRTPRRQLMNLALVPLASVAAVALNPAGLGVIEAPFSIPGYGKWVAEWGHTQPVGTLAALTVEVMVIETLGLWLLNRRKLSWSRVLLLLSAVFWLFYAYRTVAVAAVIMGLLLAEAIQSMVASIRSVEPARAELSVVPVARRERWALGGAALAVLVGLSLAVPHTSMEPDYVPTSLDPVLDRLPAGTVVFNTYGIGGWVVWRHPDLHPVIDGLATPYSVAWFDEFHAALETKPGWQEFVRRTGAQATLMADVFPLPDAMMRQGWVVLAKAQGYIVLVRPGLARRLGVGSAAS